MTDTGYYARDTFSATAAQTAFTYTFPVLHSDHIKLAINGIAETDFTISGTTLTLGGTVPALSLGDQVRIYRETPRTFATLLFQATAVDHIDDTDLDTLVKSLLYVEQEILDRQQIWWSTAEAGFTADPDVTDGWLIDSTAGIMTIALPPVADVLGKQLHFFKINAGNAVTLDPDGSETINQASSKSFSVQNDAWTISATSEGWVVLSAQLIAP
jgi:hypothetical protein